MIRIEIVDLASAKQTYSLYRFAGEVAALSSG
jgi:hypothetical protein